jgi:predicted DNA-binding transcriptional regulator AlpA
MAKTTKKDSTADAAADAQLDVLVPEDEFAKILGGLSRITIWKRTLNDPGFPPIVKLGRRAFRRRSDIVRYLDRLGEEAVERQREMIDRGKRAAERTKALKSSNTRKRAA